ncbi:MAG: glycosyltransferase family 39 protein [Bacillus sp. (in: Bacteria)]|nr:glycosyltransferase family 39 protein [Bacillus sp. (in: firmicutes)]MCM1427678.1 glycosyltransferase family 39 protein [Eubacterium sp.]
MEKLMLNIKKHGMTIGIWGIVLFFTGLYISLLFNHNIWTDEAFTLQLLRGNVKDIIAGTAADVHPPLYYLYAKLFAAIFGSSLIVQKIAAIIPMTALLIFMATVIRKRFGHTACFLTLLFFTCIPCSMEFALQVRMYSLAVFCVTVCGVYAYLAYTNGAKSDFFLFALSGTAAAYTHYFAFVSVIVIAGFLFLAIVMTKRERLTKWLVSAAGMIVCYLPWTPFFIKQVTSVEAGYWIPEITPEAVWGYFTWTFDLELVPGMVFVFLIMLKGASTYNTIKIAKEKNVVEIYALICMLVPALTMILGVILSWLKTPIYREQYVFPALGLLALFFGLSMKDAKKSILTAASVFLLFVGAVQYKECFRQEYRSTYVPQTESFFEQNLKENDYVIYNWEAFGFIYECYFPSERLEYVERFDFSGDFDTVWFLHTEWMPEIDEAALTENGLQMEVIGHYGIEHNEFDIYKICRE